MTQPYSEEKIDNIDRRLDEIVGLLQTLPANASQTHRASPQTYPQEPNVTQQPTPIPTQAETVDSSVVEGESSLAAQFTFAHDFVQRVAGTGPAEHQGSGEELQQRLEELSKMVVAYRQCSTPEETVYPHARPVPRPNLHGCELPPIQETVAIIRVAEC